jgi:hypothetical protein
LDFILVPVTAVLPETIVPIVNVLSCDVAALSLLLADTVAADVAGVAV